MQKNFYLFLLCAFAFVSCHNSSNNFSDKTVFRYNESFGITSLDPAFAKDQSNIWACVSLYNGLVQLDTALRITPCIAHDWEITDSSKTYTFHLRNDVYFHEDDLFSKNPFGKNTRIVTANDFVYSLQRLIDPKVAASGEWVMNNVVKDAAGNLSGVTAINDSTLQIHLIKPFSPFLGLLSMPYCSVIPKEVADHYGNDFRSHPVGTGPFKFKLWKDGVKLIFLKNENYFEKKNGEQLPYLDAVEISFINDRQSAFIEFLKGNLDFLNSLDASYKDELLTRSGKLQAKYQDRFVMQTQPFLNTEYLGILMDTASPVMKANPLRQKLIRQALNYGFDRAKMITYLRNNIGTPATSGFVPLGLPSFDSEKVKGYDYNPQKTRELLKQAGFENGNGLPEIVMSTTTTYLDLCEYIKSQWEELGFKIKIDVNQAAPHRKMVAEQKLAFFRGSWIADYPDAENYLAVFYSKNFAPAGPNYTHFSNPEFDMLYEKATAEANDSIRYTCYRQMDNLVINEAPVVCLFYDKVLHLTQNNISGLGSNGMNLLVLKEVKKKVGK